MKIAGKQIFYRSSVPRLAACLVIALCSLFLNSAAIARPQLVDKEVKPDTPVAVGASAEEADVVFWFVSSDDEPYTDPVWAEHRQLLKLMNDNEINARVEHYYLSQLNERWKLAVKDEQLPSFIVHGSSEGLIRQLMAEGVVRDVISTRLIYPDATSSCNDFETLSRICHVLKAPKPELTERAITVLLAPRSDARLGSLAQLGNVERVLLTSKAKEAAEAWFKYDFLELEKQWHERAPQRLASKTIDKEWAQSEREYRQSTQFRKVKLYGNSNLVLAIIETVTEWGPKEQVAWFRSRSFINQSPVFVMLARVDGGYRILVVGTFRYEVDMDNSTGTALFSFPNTKPQAATEAVSKAEILEPSDRTVFGNDTFKVRWKSSQTASESDNFFLIRRHRDGGIEMQLLEVGKELETFVGGESEIAIWNIASDGRIEFSNTVHLSYDPELPPKEVPGVDEK